MEIPRRISGTVAVLLFSFSLFVLNTSGVGPIINHLSDEISIMLDASKDRMESEPNYCIYCTWDYWASKIDGYDCNCMERTKVTNPCCQSSEIL